HWLALDSEDNRMDCISLASLAAKHMNMVGIPAKIGLAYTPGFTGQKAGVFNASALSVTEFEGKKYVLGFFAAKSFNQFEGFFEYKVKDMRRAFTVDPALGPIFETDL